MNSRLLLTGLSLSVVVPGFCADKQAKKEQRQNVLFIICDDLRTELECYNHPLVKSPNISRLAAEGVVFDRAFCNVPVSGASRASFLTGMRPTRDRFEFWNLRVDDEVPSAVTLNQSFKEAGYTTISNGKVFHHQDESSGKYWDSILHPRNNTPMDYQTDENLFYMRVQKETGIRKRGMFYETGSFSDSTCVDGRTLRRSIADLRQLAVQDKPFFLAVGFIRPHLPFIVPQRFWDMYDDSEIVIPDNYVLKKGNKIPKKALTHWGELLAYRGIPDQGPLDHQTARNMIHGYYASVSYVDFLVGQLLDELERLGLDRNTTVVFIGDHGWNLGEHGMWCKHSVMHTSLHAPLIVRRPGALKGYRTNEVVEYVDLYPTLCDAAGIPKPKQLEGESLYPMLYDKDAKSKGYAVSRWENSFTYTDGQYSYTEWWDKNDNTVERMLFDHATDPDENYNVADREWYREIVKDLSAKLRTSRGPRFFEK